MTSGWLWRCVAGVVVAGVVAGASATARADETVVHDAAGTDVQVSFVGDSTLAGVRWYADYGALERFDFVLNAESCRRTLETSCFSREGFRSENVLSTMASLDGQLGEVVVIMSGYNDPVDSIDDAIDAVVDEARRQGVDHVVWLTLRTSGDVAYSDPQEQSSVDTFRVFNEQLVDAAEASDGFLQIADWATYSNGASGWFEYDGVHLSPSGVDALTTFLAGIVDRVLAGDDVSPAAAPWTLLVPGAEGETVAEVQQAIIDAGVDLPGGADGYFGNDTMAAVAEYQRLDGDLQVTGAVDMATARSLGVLVDETAPAAEPSAPDPLSPATTIAAPGVEVTDVGAGDAPADEALAVERGGSNVWLVVIVGLGVVVGGLSLRRRPPAERGARSHAPR